MLLKWNANGNGTKNKTENEFRDTKTHEHKENIATYNLYFCLSIFEKLIQK